MSKGNLLLGYGRGKLGDIVLSRSGGRQIARARNREPRNPRSIAQQYQRMAFATAAATASAFKGIVNHSYEGIAYGTPSRSVFMRNAVAWLRAAALSNSVVANFNIKGLTFAQANPLELSRGSLSMNNVSVYSVSEDDVVVRIALQLKSAPATTAFTTQAAYEAELGKLGLVPGDQLTYAALLSTTGVDGYADFGDATNYGTAASYARVTFVKNIPANFSGLLIVDGAFNPALVERVDGVMPLLVNQDGEYIIFDGRVNDTPVLAATLIRSQQKSEGEWLRSNSKLHTAMEQRIADEDAMQAYARANDVLGSYSTASAENLGSKLILDNALTQSPK